MGVREGSVPHDEAPSDFSSFEGVVGFVDLLERPCAGEEFIEGEGSAAVEMDDSRKVHAGAHRAVEGALEGFLCVEQLIDVDAGTGIGSADSGHDAGPAFSRGIECLFDRFCEPDGLEREIST